MSAFMLTDGTSVVSLNPEWDFKLTDKKVETVHRTRSGAQYRYLWGSQKGVKFKVEYVSSSDRCVVNSWWGANSALQLFDASSTIVLSGYLASSTPPIAEYAKPYDDQFNGVIDLETY